MRSVAGPATVSAILERQSPAVPFGDLPAQREADTRPAGLGREERNEQVARALKAGSFVLDATTSMSSCVIQLRRRCRQSRARRRSRCAEG